ncbi:hypothetical protein TRIUR3_10556 [Triticum urartu]|uniref:Uncharacterized protein n=2 Tax=Triticum TaxID=4564 RepID=A0A9R1BTR0_TRITD|nr:hypothetical protein TRIUR3_10556 [Triticum urartu]VAI80729.1 unnamed protein product [Triticum turgidum subsp. durum]
MAAMSAEGQICAADGVVDTEIDGLLQASEQSITRFVRSTQKPQHGLEADGISGLACTVRIGAAAPGRSPCRNRTSALEKAIHGFAENPGDDVIVPALGTSFDCLSEAFDYCHWTSILLDEAYDFYKLRFFD